MTKSFCKAIGVSSRLKTYAGDQPSTLEDLWAHCEMCAGSTLFNLGFTECRNDSGCGFAAGGEAAVAPEDEGGHPTLPLTGFLPEAAMRLWTTADAIDAEVSTG